MPSAISTNYLRKICFAGANEPIKDADDASKFETGECAFVFCFRFFLIYDSLYIKIWGYEYILICLYEYMFI